MRVNLITIQNLIDAGIIIGVGIITIKNTTVFYSLIENL